MREVPKCDTNRIFNLLLPKTTTARVRVLSIRSTYPQYVNQRIRAVAEYGVALRSVLHFCCHF
jgi:hypothetical protein